MKTPCLECKHLAPIARIPEGDPREIQVGHLGMLARGLAQCSYMNPGQKYKRFRSIQATEKCPRFEPVNDKARVEKRIQMAKRLQAEFNRWFSERKSK